MERTVYNALPKIPGFDFPELHPPATTRLPQLCTISLGGRTVLEAGARRRKGEEQANVGECGGLTRAEILDKFPQWKSMDDKVLRFFAYYVERVDESSLEKERVRKVKMCFFLVDGTVSVCETPATVNSGIRRGTTVSRCKVDGVDVFSLYVGASVRIRGLDYVIVDCDAATREFLAVMGMPQAEPYDYPTDAFETTIAATRQPADEHQAAMRRSMAAATRLETGTVTSVLTQEEREKARNFFEHDRKVLRFMGAWDNKMFRIQFYIADQTLSVMLEHVRNDGLDPNPVFIRRTKIPKCPTTRTRDTETLNLPLGPPIQYVGEDDLRTGKSVNLFTRDFYIFDCDEFTRTYYKARGIEQKPFPPPEVEVRTFMTEKSRKTVEISSTRKTVDGASTMTFEDKFVPKDCLKLVRYCNDVFRFAARIANPTPENEGRRFLFCYYLADDTVGMFEIPVPNSGHTGGKCFTRAPVPEINEPGKLCVGAHVKLAGTEYVLTEMDERTKRYIAMGMPNMDDGYFATQDLIGFAKQVIAQRFSRLTDAFRHFRSRKEGLTSDDLRHLFAECGRRLDADELGRLMAAIDQDKDQLISLIEFSENLLGHKFISDFTPRDCERPSIARGPLRSEKAIEAARNLEMEADEALRKFISLSEARRVMVIRACQTTADSTYDGNIGIEDFKVMLKERLKLPIDDVELDLITFKFFHSPGVEKWTKRRLPVKEFRRLIML